MRIIIDTEKKVISCPKQFWDDMAKKNAVLREVGQKEVSHKEEVKKYFNEAIVNELVRPQDIRTPVRTKK